MRGQLSHSDCLWGLASMFTFMTHCHYSDYGDTQWCHKNRDGQRSPKEPTEQMIFYYIYAGLYHQDKLKTYRLPDRTPPRLAQQFDMFYSAPAIFPPLSWWLTLIIIFCICRYIDSQYCKVMQDIVSSKLYKEQFDAIQECFRNIGFTEEVLSCLIKQGIWLQII